MVQQVTYVTQAQEHTIPIYCQEWGDRNNPNILVCVHGLTRNAHDFDFLAARLEQNYRVICPDMPGRGASPNIDDPALYRNDIYAYLMTQLLAQAGATTVDWVGTSMGGIIGMFIAATQPQFIRKMVLNDVGAFIPKESLERIKSYAGRAESYATKEEALTGIKSRYASFGIQTEEHWQHILNHSFKQDAAGRWVLSCDPKVMQAMLGAEQIEDVNLWPVWEKIACPVLVIRGEKSDLLSKTASEMATRKNVALVEIPGAGHAPALYSDAEIDIVEQWLKARD